MRFGSRSILIILALGASPKPLAAQQAVSSIEQARLFQTQPTATNTAVNADGMALATGDSESDDDSFGSQIILKNQPRLRTFVVSGDASVFYTNNVGLTRSDRTDDVFLVAHAGANWTPRLARNVEGQIGANVSIFRYDRTSELDFNNLTVGAGLAWSPESCRGLAIFARYDFIELLDRHGDEILRDHEFTVGAQKVFVFGRSHALTLGASGMVGLSEPDSAQRDQLGVFAGYHLQLTRALAADLFYRFALHFYNDSGRIDRNHVLSGNLRYHLTRWAEANAFFTFGNNRSDDGAFDYDVLSLGAGVGAAVRF